jgi:hypothetical protein
MSRATSPAPHIVPLRAQPSPHLCGSTLDLAAARQLHSPGTRIVLVQAGANTYYTGVEMKGAIYCIHCFGGFSEHDWRAHTYAPPRRLLALGNMGVEPADGVKRWRSVFWCCEQAFTLGCMCESRTGWFVVSTAADALYRLGLPTPPDLAAVSVQEAARRIRADPCRLGPQLGLGSTHWLASSLSLMASSPAHAVSGALTLSHSPEIDRRLQLRAGELELVCCLFLLAGTCPITCTCASRRCLHAVRTALGVARARKNRTAI